MKRELSTTFMTDLLTGSLKMFLLYPQGYTLDIEIREKFVNIYYRGGNILRITEIGIHSYEFEFDSNYLPTKSVGFIAPVQ